MERLRRLGWTVVVVPLPAAYPWGLFPSDRTVLLRQGLSRAGLRRALRCALAAAQAADRGPRRA